MNEKLIIDWLSHRRRLIDDASYECGDFSIRFH